MVGNKADASNYWRPKREVLEDEITRLADAIEHHKAEIKALERKIEAARVEQNRITEAITLGRLALVHRQKWATPRARYKP